MRILMPIAAAALLGLSSCAPSGSAESGEGTVMQDRPVLGLMTTLPILWTESDDIGDLLSVDAPAHWAKTALEQDYTIAPLDTLSADGLATVDVLVLAQPRMLTPQENVALDDWVRDGGRVLMFADPMLTGHSRYGIGDRRRPQDVALLDTILARWGLRLLPPDASTERRHVALGTGELPLEAYGTLEPRETAGDAPSDCTSRLGGVLAECEIGRGRAIVLADAALLEEGEAADPAERDALRILLGMARETSRTPSGKSGE